VLENGVEPCMMQTQCLVDGPASALLRATVRFLQPLEKDIGALAAPIPVMPPADNPDFFHVVPHLEIEGQVYDSTLEALERTIELPALSLDSLADQPRTVPFSFTMGHSVEPILDHRQHIAGVVVRCHESISGVVEFSAEPVDVFCHRLTLTIKNTSRVPSDVHGDKDEIMMRTFVSTHTVLQATGGEFVSLIDPPEVHAKEATECHNIGTWPVLIGDSAKMECDAMLSSPIILYDYPDVPPEAVAVENPSSGKKASKMKLDCPGNAKKKRDATKKTKRVKFNRIAMGD
jgi:hydrogenase maturation protease